MNKNIILVLGCITLIAWCSDEGLDEKKFLKEQLEKRIKKKSEVQHNLAQSEKEKHNKLAAELEALKKKLEEAEKKSLELNKLEETKKKLETELQRGVSGAIKRDLEKKIEALQQTINETGNAIQATLNVAGEKIKATKNAAQSAASYAGLGITRTIHASDKKTPGHTLTNQTWLSSLSDPYTFGRKAWLAAKRLVSNEQDLYNADFQYYLNDIEKNAKLIVTLLDRIVATTQFLREHYARSIIGEDKAYPIADKDIRTFFKNVVCKSDTTEGLAQKIREEAEKTMKLFTTSSSKNNFLLIKNKQNINEE